MGVLNGLTIAVAGTLDYDNTQIKKWVEANGGRYSPSVSKHITHLITSKEAWKNAVLREAVAEMKYVQLCDWPKPPEMRYSDMVEVLQEVCRGNEFGMTWMTHSIKQAIIWLESLEGKRESPLWFKDEAMFNASYRLPKYDILLKYWPIQPELVVWKGLWKRVWRNANRLKVI